MKLLIISKNSIVEPISGGLFPRHTRDQKLLPKVKDKVQALVDEGWTISLESNEGGVELGIKTIEQAYEEMIYAMVLLGNVSKGAIAPSYEKNGKGKAIFINRDKEGRVIAIPFASKDKRYRKPECGMIKALVESAKEDSKEEPSELLYVGSRDEDLQACLNMNRRIITEKRKKTPSYPLVIYKDSVGWIA